MALLTFTPINALDKSTVDQAQNVYNQQQGNVAQAQQQEQDFQKNMVNGQDLYAQQQQVGNQWAGYDPAKLQQSLHNVQQTQNVIAGLPQSINAQNANYGATASNLAGQYSGQMANLNPALAAQTNAAAVNQATQQAAAGYAQNATTAGIQTQQQKLTGLQQIYQAAQAQYTTAQTQLSQLQQLYEEQGQFNSSQQAAYEQANASMVAAQAQAQQAAAQSALFASQTQYQNMQNQFLSSGKDANGQPIAKASTPSPNIGATSSNSGNTGGLGNVLSGLSHAPEINFGSLLSPITSAIGKWL